ncbi:probable E3 ubiquitin-protein ligase HERC4 [Strongylocentrotus purpuratus]|uniref:HECT-type E3 ubiquitin transferase n=1 Tax=Strongylocentrotus purpuratus TaxID=7668 RepID=A0A7M7NRL2_STRPU|nr:probable E3 ubiquitin-protein ligase HERC4 [Strongylocentrotus purpuratus]
MEEIRELDKDFADQMSKLLSTEEDILSELELELELENGERVEVTEANVHLYVKKKVRDYLAPLQFARFQQGFNKVCDTKVLGIFRPVELEALVTGDKYFDWDALEKSTRYKDPYTDSHSTIKMFWEVFHALDDNQKREFLVFVAGSDRVPVGGLQNLGLTIAELQIPRDDAVDDHDEESSEDRMSRLCPVAHCCDNNEYNRTLDLPMYTSKELVKDRLMATLSFSNSPFHIA